MSRTKIVFLMGFILLIIAPVAVAQAQAPSSEGQGSAVIADGQGLSDRITYTMTGMANLGPE